MKTVSLNFPITVGDKKVSSLTFRRANVGDMMVSSHFNDLFSKSAAVLASMADVDIPTFKQIDAADFNRMLDECKDLMGNAPTATTGLT